MFHIFKKFIMILLFTNLLANLAILFFLAFKTLPMDSLASSAPATVEAERDDTLAVENNDKVAAETVDSSEQTIDSSKKVPVLMYHHLSENEEDISSATIRPKSFRNQMETLKNEGYETITPKQLKGFLDNQEQLPEKPVLITFDDGYYSNYEYAYPVLKDLDMKATIFIIADMCEVRKCWIDPLGWEKVEEMSDSGLISFGSHTYNTHLHGITEQEEDESFEEYKERIQKDLHKSKNLVKAYTGQDFVSFSYPKGKYDEESMSIAKDVGYELAFTINSDVANQDSTPLEIERINVPNDTSGEDLISTIENLKQ